MILTLIALPLLFLSVITMFKVQHILLWKLSILSTEYGHWLTLLSIALLVFFAIKRPRGFVAGFQLTTFIVATLIFARPVVQAEWLNGKWSSDLRATFAAPLQQPLFSFKRLWWGSLPAISPKRHVFSKESSGDLFFDFYPALSGKPAPLVVIVHGGGWNNGDPSILAELNSHLARKGYAVAAISYRLAPAAKWPAQREDVLKAVAYIEKNAASLNVDSTQWVILGRSAGGHIAEAVAYQVKDPTLKGLIAFHAPADLDFAYKYATDKDIINSRDLLVGLIGDTPLRAPELYKDASPIEFVGPDSPPTLLIHGEMDPLTWNVQSRRLIDKLKKFQVRAAYIEMPWATHAFDFNLKGPGGQVSTRAVEEFLSAVLH